MNNLCIVKSVCRSIGEYERNFQKKFNISLNEGLILCSLKYGKRTSGEIASELDLSCSNTSKVLRSVEDKMLIMRTMGEEDKRQMFFVLTDEGFQILEKIEEGDMEIPDILKSLQ